MKNVAKCDTWCELQNPVNHRVFERKLRPKPSGRGHVCLGVTNRPLDDAKSSTRPQVRRDHPLSLSISISGGKETNKDSLSNGERTGKSPA
ncbi:hypothetical protein EUTSA_v10028342mg [Eutrema salsugineum]|uniref:Uncharacterized protein n=1 Tax=Eutrema salsugineum TaxID=72664 RepID=V4NLS4_EUTSA|nr:hypothetical protein EUTSA_v10028342mg [Eutrema salsugineum]